MEKFKKVFKRTLGFEGGVSDHSSDRGGLTNMGVTTVTYNEAVRLGIISHRPEGVLSLSEEETATIYYEMYWKPLNLDHVEDSRIAGEIFDTGINAGVSKSAKIVQRALQALGEDLKRDGVIGSITLAFINKWIEVAPVAFFKLLNALQGAYYVEITENNPTQSVFLEGWMKRVQFYFEEEEKVVGHPVLRNLQGKKDGETEEEYKGAPEVIEFIDKKKEEEVKEDGDKEQPKQRRQRRQKGFKGLAGER